MYVQDFGNPARPFLVPPSSANGSSPKAVKHFARHLPAPTHRPKVVQYLRGIATTWRNATCEDPRWLEWTAPLLAFCTNAKKPIVWEVLTVWYVATWPNYPAEFLQHQIAYLSLTGRLRYDAVTTSWHASNGANALVVPAKNYSVDSSSSCNPQNNHTFRRE